MGGVAHGGQPADGGGQLLGDRYRLIARLGVGGMSVVWRGHDEILGRQVAVKVLAPEFAPDQVVRNRIRVEAQAAARLCHPHITNVYDYGEAVRQDATLPYVVMELVDGESLAARLRREHRLPWRTAVVACAEVASALAAAHTSGVVHRDVTPANVMLTSTGVKVVDFGISALAGENDVGPDGNLLGTPAYLAPERLNGGQVSPATDVYAVGLLLYRSLTGRLPWQAATITQMLRAHLHTAPDPMPPVAGLPAEVVALTHRCLAKRPADRPTSEEVAKILAAAVGVNAGLSPSMVALPLQATPEAGGGSAAATAALPESDLVSVTSGLEVTGLDIAGSADDDPAVMDPAVMDPAVMDPAVMDPAVMDLDVPVEIPVDVPVAVAAGPDGAVGPAPAAPTTPSPPATPGAPRRRRLRTSWVQRRAEAAMISIGVLVVGTLVWAGAAPSTATERARQAVAAPPFGLTAQSPAPCQVDYQVRDDTGERFVAAVQVTNTGTAELTDWSLRFVFPGDQRLGAVEAVRWQQDGATVRLRPAPDAGPLPVGSSTVIQVDGTYQAANPLPLAFQLDDADCAVTVVGMTSRSAAPGDT
ncbi:serine/threonine-protein kinase [Solwaraspora sp. WMMD406]|uniref:serine/threonine-protein kinase n=1 Tax=Solwaraspora sp. WMMD406 TaxID=3016095 RepID=UPI002416EDE1|nr:serine/threonine-protein kinase [Solwaraspora sp. WMMD406]MDG4763587.1 serine/threonine-protein kinase [Solwaraspora sp. WMMD406]